MLSVPHQTKKATGGGGTHDAYAGGAMCDEVGS